MDMVALRIQMPGRYPGRCQRGQTHRFEMRAQDAEPKPMIRAQPFWQGNREMQDFVALGETLKLRFDTHPAGDGQRSSKPFDTVPKHIAGERSGILMPS
jgi:hypothetical protein